MPGNFCNFPPMSILLQVTVLHASYVTESICCPLGGTITLIGNEAPIFINKKLCLGNSTAYSIILSTKGISHSWHAYSIKLLFHSITQELRHIKMDQWKICPWK